MFDTQVNLKEALKQHFGFNNFKGNQEKIIQSLMEGNNTFVLMPTGGGKSLCYQLPALLLEGTAIIISPLIALMKNQVDSIRSYSEADEVAHFLNSSLSKTQMRKVKEDIVDGKTKLLFVAPETLTKQENLDFFNQVKISFVAVDEAHCISEWGHDFRPEYRRIKEMINLINSETPLMALTATATPKVQTDIVKNLGLDKVNTFVSSFNRENLYYEVRPKGKRDHTIKSMIQFINERKGKSGIIYVQSRKGAEKIAQDLKVNGVNAAPYHAGLDAKTRSNTQDNFLMEEIDVIVATIAFGMGIDKPDIRFVIHYDIPKSIENYYQETGRGGRDGLEGDCLLFYSYKDIMKLEKFLRGKLVAEREMGTQLMDEIVAYSETSACRRQFLLHYFGEHFEVEACNKMCDNCRHPKEKLDASKELAQIIKAVEQLNEKFRIGDIINFIQGKDQNKELASFDLDKLSMFGAGKEKEDIFWNSVIRNALLKDYIQKDIENYGLIRVTPKGEKFLKNPEAFEIALNHDFEQLADAEEADEAAASKSMVLDPELFNLLKGLRKSVAKEKNVPPFVIFQDPSLEDMATQYPVTMDGMANITGVSIGKAQRYGRKFLDLIKKYVEENDIDRPNEIVVKSVVNKSSKKVSIIQSIDRKISLEEIARNNSMSMEDLLLEIETIVNSGTKLNIDYYLEDAMDEYTLEDVYNYFMEAETDLLETAFEELKEDEISMEEIQLVRIKFMSELAN